MMKTCFSIFVRNRTSSSFCRCAIALSIISCHVLFNPFCANCGAARGFRVGSCWDSPARVGGWDTANGLRQWQTSNNVNIYNGNIIGIVEKKKTKKPLYSHWSKSKSRWCQMCEVSSYPAVSSTFFRAQINISQEILAIFLGLKCSQHSPLFTVNKLLLININLKLSTVELQESMYIRMYIYI